MRAARIVALVIGVLLTVAGFGAAAGGVAMVAVHGTQRDGAGFYTSSTERLGTSTAVLVSQVEVVGALAPAHPLGTVRLTATPAPGGGPLFVGIARQSDVDRWLSGTRYERITNVRSRPFQADTVIVPGERTAGAPTEQDFWVASASGSGTQTLTWTSEPGRWSAVLMNADGSTGVAADVTAGVRTGVLLPVGLALGGFGLLLLLGGLVLIVAGVRKQPAVAAASPGTAGHPVRLDARLDERLSRWLWLVKWLLVLPHAVVLALLWLALVPLTVVAGIAILVTGRYPRSIFDFTVGVLRWTWRVSYYSYSALATDRYPPFSLRPDPSYPADFTVDYPEHLSRGLVLVKWWLLAIPHYVIVALFAGGWSAWPGYTDANGHYVRPAAIGLIGALVLVGAVVLLFSGRYPKPLYDLVVGLNRWCFRVAAYAMLLRDEYPPFRLDMGGTDPGSVPAAPPPVPPPDRAHELVGSM